MGKHSLKVGDVAVEVELAYLLSAVEAAACSGEPVPPPAGVDWVRLLKYASQTKALPLLGWIFARGEVSAPDWVAELTTVSRRYHGASARIRRAAARELAEALRDADIDVAFRKGVHVSTLYPELAGRPFNDLDLFARREQLAAVGRVTRALGYAEQDLDRAGRLYMRVATNVVPPFFRDEPILGFALCVDVATAAQLPAMAGGAVTRADRQRDEVSEMLDRAVDLGDGTPVLSPAHLLVDLAVNTYICGTTMRYVNRRRFQRLVSYVDLLVAAAACQPNDWATFDAHVDAFDLGTTVGYAFAHCVQLFPANPICAEFEKRLTGDLASASDRIAEFDPGGPYTWRIPLPARLILDDLPTDLPGYDGPL